MNRRKGEAPPERRTQAERRAGTRRALLDATVSCLSERGYSGATTPEICSRAGVSQGALFKHFPSKQALMAAAVEHLFGALLEGFVADITVESRRRDPVEAAVQRLWQAFLSPQLAAVLELYVAARSDDSLRENLTAVVAAHALRLREAASRLFPDTAGNERFALVLDLVLELMQGMAVSRIVDPDEAHRRRLLAFAAELAREARSRTAAGASVPVNRARSPKTKRRSR